MATLDSVTSKMRSLIANINGKTGRSDANIADAVDALISGYNPSGTTPSGTKTITENGTHDVAGYASAFVNVSAPAQISVVRSITIDTALGNGTNTAKTILTADAFVEAHYADDGFYAVLIPTETAGTTTNTVTWLHHGNRNIGSTGCIRYGFAFYNSSATALGYRPCDKKASEKGYNVSFRAKDTGDLDIYVESGRIVQAGNYLLVLALAE